LDRVRATRGQGTRGVNEAFAEVLAELFPEDGARVLETLADRPDLVNILDAALDRLGLRTRSGNTVVLNDGRLFSGSSGSDGLFPGDGLFTDENGASRLGGILDGVADAFGGFEIGLGGNGALRGRLEGTGAGNGLVRDLLLGSDRGGRSDTRNTRRRAFAFGLLWARWMADLRADPETDLLSNTVAGNGI